MSNSTISIFGNKIFLEIIKELKLFPKVKYYDDLDTCLNNCKSQNSLSILFLNEKNKNFFSKNKINNFSSILILEKSNLGSIYSDEFIEKLIMPFTILEFKKKVISQMAKSEFRKNSLIQLNEYIIDKNERKIKKENNELQLSEKEINFLILFSQSKEPVTRKSVLKNVWNYSSETETHTIETHIYRLRKKILEKFGDNNFIKNNQRGYFI